MKHWILAAMAALFAGCGTLRPDRPEPLADHLPETYGENGGDAVLTGAWWHSFGSEELNRLLDEALEGNLTIAQYSARLRQQQALAAKANAGKSPSMTGTASAGTTWPDVTETAAPKPMPWASRPPMNSIFGAAYIPPPRPPCSTATPAARISRAQ
jgi:outer membrane protein TolC